MCIQSDYFDPRTFMPVGQQCDAHNKGQRGAAKVAQMLNDQKII